MISPARDTTLPRGSFCDGFALTKSDELLGPYKQYIPAITAIFLFLTLKSAGSLFAFILAAFAALILQTLAKLNVIIIQERDKKK
jgi:hypothetical protein